MKRLKLIAALLILSLASTFALDGLSPFGRMALKLGQPKIAEMLLSDPGWKGHAQYLQGHYAQAAETQRGAGSDGYFHRANALARDGGYLLAFQILDAHLYRTPSDRVARKNKELFGELSKVTGEGSKGPNSGMPFKTIDLADPLRSPDQIWRESGGRRKFSESEVQANMQWLATMTDAPGSFLRLRIAAERERREREGLHQPPMEVPW